MAHELYGQKVSDSFYGLVQYIGGNYYDGSGNLLDISTGISVTYIDGSIAAAVNAVDISLVTYVNSYNIIQDASIAAFEANDVTFSDVSISVALGVDAVDTSLVTYVDAYNNIQDTSVYAGFNRLDASIDLKLNNTTDTFTGILRIDGCLGINIAPEFTLDVSGSGRFGNTDVIGQSIIGYGLIINNEENATDIGNFQVKSRNYNIINVDASEDSIVIIDDSSGKIGFFGETPSIQSTGWNITNVSENKIYDGDNTSVAELINVFGTLINELKTKGIIG